MAVFLNKKCPEYKCAKCATLRKILRIILRIMVINVIRARFGGCG
jgi:hypothetical protein